MPNVNDNLTLPPYRGFCLVTRRVLDTQLSASTAYKRLSKVGSISILAQAWLESCPVSIRVQLADRAQSKLLAQLTAALGSLANTRGRLRPQHIAVSLLDAICELVDSVQLEIHAVAGREVARAKVFDLLYRIQAKAVELLALLSNFLRLVSATKVPLEPLDEDGDELELELPYWSHRSSLLAVNDEEVFKKLSFADSPSVPSFVLEDDDAESMCSSSDDEGSAGRSFYQHSGSSLLDAASYRRGKSLDSDLHLVRRLPPPDRDRRHSAPRDRNFTAPEAATTAMLASAAYSANPKNNDNVVPRRLSRSSRHSRTQSRPNGGISATATCTKTISPSPIAAGAVGGQQQQQLQQGRQKVPLGLSMPRHISAGGRAVVEPAFRLDLLLSTVTATFPAGLDASLQIQLDKQREYTLDEVAALQRRHGAALEPLKLQHAPAATAVLRHDGDAWTVHV